MSQYTLALQLPTVFAEENFFISPSNFDAHQLVMSWPHWPSHALLLVGPAGSGKSHLAHIWAVKSGASFISASALDTMPELKTPLLVEDIERLTSERALFHLFNYAKENNLSLLMTSALPAAQLPFTLPDLTSRLKATPAAIIGEADDALIAAAMRKQFSDRQLKVSEDVITYMLPRMERSLAAANTLIARLDEQALAEQRELTVPFIRRVLGW